MRLQLDDRVYEREVTGTFFRAETDRKVRGILDFARMQGLRMRITYGDPRKDFAPIKTMSGFVSRSNTEPKVPLLVESPKSGEGVPVLDHMIVKIEPTTRKARELNKDLTWERGHG